MIRTPHSGNFEYTNRPLNMKNHISYTFTLLLLLGILSSFSTGNETDKKGNSKESSSKIDSNKSNHPGVFLLSSIKNSTTAKDNFIYKKKRDTFGYTRSFNVSSFVEIAGTGTDTGISFNGEEVYIQMPFEFDLYGTVSRDLTIGDNGAILFDDTSASNIPATNETFPNATYPLMIAPYWDTLDPNTGTVYYDTQGTAPNRSFIVQWDAVDADPASGGTGTFEVILYEGTNNIDFIYQDANFNGSNNDDGESATVGINRDGTDAELNSFNVDDGSVDDGLDIRFTHPDNAVGMSFTSSTTAQNSAGIGVDAGSTQQGIIRVEVVVDGNSTPLNATNFDFNTTGTTDPANDIQNARVYYTGTSPDFATDVQFGSTVASPNGTFSVASTQALVNGTNYFWLAYDIQGGATDGNFVDAECTALTVGSVRTPTVTAPSGNREIGGGTGFSCTAALDITPACGTTVTVNGTTVGGDTALNATCTATSNTEPKTWYTFVGNGAAVTATTIDIGSPLNDTQIWVYSGTCAGLTCVTGNDDATGLFSNVTFTATEGTTYYIVVGEFNNNPTASGPFQLDVTFDAAMTYTSSTSTQNTTIVPAAATDEQVIGIEVVMANNCDPLDLTSLTFNTTGSTDAANDIDNARVYYTGTSGTFTTTTQVGATQANPNGTFTVTGFTQALSAGTNHFWLAYDIAAAATDGNVVDGQCTSITVDGGAQTPTVTSPAGSRTIGNTGTTCADALTITPVCGTTITINGATTGGDVTNYGTCGTAGNTVEKIWHRFTGNGATVTATTIDIGDPNLDDTKIWVYSGVCGATVCVDGNDDASGLYSSVTFTATEGTTYYIVVGGFAAADVGNYELDVTFDAAMTYTSSTTTQNTSSTIQSAINEQIIGVEIVVAGNCDPLDVTSLTFNTTGSTDATNDIDNARVFYTGTSNTFATTTQVGATETNPNGTFTVTGFTQALSDGTNYFWLAYDIAATATDDNVVDGQCTSITVDGVIRTPAILVPSGSRTINPDVTVFRGNQLDFDGGDYLVATGYTGITGSNNRTIEMWVRSNQNANRTLMEWGINAAPNGRRWLIQRRTDGAIRVNIRGSQVTTATTGDFIDTDDGNWHHVAIVLNGTTLDDINFYVDGMLQDKSSSTTTVNTVASSNLHIGSTATQGNNYIGEMDEVRLWDDARTQDEIRENMHITLMGTEPNLVSYWQFNESSGTTHGDVTGTNTLTRGDGATTSLFPTIETSTVAVAGGVSDLRIISTTGNTIFNGTSVSMNFTTAPSTTTDFVVYKLTGEDAPGNVVTDDIGSLNTVTNAYWVFRHFDGNSPITFVTDVSFDLGNNGTGVSATDAATPSNLKLLSRSSNSFGAWSSVEDADAAVEATGVITFNGVTGFSQFKVGSIANSALPITLKSFEGFAKDGNHHLEWITSSEINNDYFQLERSSDGQNFEVITTIDGAGTTSEEQYYKYIDVTPFFGKNYYRLRQVDVDGQSEYADKIVLIENVNSLEQLSYKLYPNPADRSNINLSISSPDSDRNIHITLFDLFGRQYYHKEMSPSELNVEVLISPMYEMKSGLYLVLVEQGDQRVQKKLIIE